MQSIRELYRIGRGPSSSHTMGPQKAARQFIARFPESPAYRVTLYGSLAATGKGHLTDVIIQETFGERPLTILWRPEIIPEYHPNGMLFEALSGDGQTVGRWQVYSVGGGALREEGETSGPVGHFYDRHTMQEILDYHQESGLSLWEYGIQQEGQEIWAYLQEIWQVMRACMEKGIATEGVLPGGLGLARKALSFYRKAETTGPPFRRTAYLSAYALAVAEENACGGRVVTAPTCGSSGVLPAVLRWTQKAVQANDEAVLRALATAGLIGNLIKFNASISGAEVGCQGEIGAACAMAAGAAVQLMGGTARQVEYAAEMGLEHHLGLTCDPVGGLVQIPCIERNAFAAARAVTCADYAIFSDGSHLISFDDVVNVMCETGHDLPSLYRETAQGGLAGVYRKQQITQTESQEGNS